MPFWKTTFLIESFQQAGSIGSGAAVGWGETWYQELAGTADAALLSFDTNRYVLYRRPCLNPLHHITWVRVSDEGNPRNSKVRFLGNLAGTASGVGLPADVAQLIDLVAFDTSPTPIAHHRRFMLRGLSVGDVIGDTINGSSVNFPAIYAFLQHIGNGTVGNPSLPTGVLPAWKIRFYPPAPVPVSPAAIAIPAASPNFIDLTSPGLVPTAGAKYRRSGVRFPYFVNRVWTYTGLEGVANH